MNSEQSQPDATMSPMDFSDMEAGTGRICGGNGGGMVWQIPFQTFAYEVMERERSVSVSVREETSKSGSEGASTYSEESIVMGEEMVVSPTEQRKSLPSPEIMMKSLPSQPIEDRRGKL